MILVCERFFANKIFKIEGAPIGRWVFLMRVCRQGCRIIFEKYCIQRALFFRIYIALSKHLGGLREFSTASRVCITVSNSPNPPRVKMLA